MDKYRDSLAKIEVASRRLRILEKVIFILLALMLLNSLIMAALSLWQVWH